jgi:hypothetical protein
MYSALLDLRQWCEGASQENPGAQTQAQPKFRGSPRRIIQSRLSRKVSKHNERGTVPQTETGVQLE